MSPLGKPGLGRKIGLVTLASLIVGLGLFSILALQSVNESQERTLSERLTIARIVAARLDQTLNYILVQLDRAATFPSGFPTQAEFDTSAAALRRVFEQSAISVDTIYVLGDEGTVAFAEPTVPGIKGFSMAEYEGTRANLIGGRSSVSGLVSNPLSETPVVLISTPILSGGRILGVLAASVDVESSTIGVLGQTLPVGKTGYAEVVDSNGMVVARSGPGAPPGYFELSDHPTRFAELIQTGSATVGKCHRCHSVENDVQKVRDVLAFAPLSSVPWGVAIRQSEDEALLPTRQLQTRLLFLGTILVLSTLGVVVTLMQNIVKPIRMLTTAANQLAGNDYDASLPHGRPDEIGQLSTAFGTMRDELKKSRREMVIRYEEAREHEQLRGQLLDSVIEAQEQERRRIARELHDEYGQTLTGLLMSIESLEGVLPEEQKRLRDRLTGAKEQIGQALGDMRRLILDLRPPSLDELGLVTAVKTYSQRQLGEMDINLTFECRGINTRLPSNLEVTVFRIIQEAVHNVVKHARAQNVDIVVSLENGKLGASVQDDGQGFDTRVVLRTGKTTHSWGIIGIRERVALMGGKFNLSSERGRGTRIEIEIPLAEANGKSSQPSLETR